VKANHVCNISKSKIITTLELHRRGEHEDIPKRRERNQGVGRTIYGTCSPPKMNPERLETPGIIGFGSRRHANGFSWIMIWRISMRNDRAGQAETLDGQMR
jgi:hypothetical protein